MRGVSRRSARSRTKKPDAVTSEMHRSSPDKQQRPGWKERYAPPFRPSRRGGRAPGKQACARSLEPKSPVISRITTLHAHERERVAAPPRKNNIWGTSKNSCFSRPVRI